MEELILLPGVGRKTANCVLGAAFGIQSGIVVDTHVMRLANRMGLTKQTDPVKIERDLMVLTPQDDWYDFSHMMILHGRQVCDARNPDCPRCTVRVLCPSADKFSKIRLKTSRTR
jgi:endonuclease-3